MKKYGNLIGVGIVVVVVVIIIGALITYEVKSEVIELEFLGLVERDGETLAIFVDHEKEEVLFDTLTEYQIKYFDKYDLKENDLYKVVEINSIENDLFIGCNYESFEEKLELSCIEPE